MLRLAIFIYGVLIFSDISLILCIYIKSIDNVEGIRLRRQSYVNC